METKTEIIKIDKFDYFEFNQIVTSNGIRAITARVYPYTNHFGYFYSLYNTIDKIKNILGYIESLKLEKEQIILGNNEFFICIENEFVIFHVTLPEHNPIQIPILEFKEFLLQFKYWLEKLESCQIPGILPESKLASWSCVPNEYIKDEWWDLQKK